MRAPDGNAAGLTGIATSISRRSDLPIESGAPARERDCRTELAQRHLRGVHGEVRRLPSGVVPHLIVAGNGGQGELVVTREGGGRRGEVASSRGCLGRGASASLPRACPPTSRRRRTPAAVADRGRRPGARRGDRDRLAVRVLASHRRLDRRAAFDGAALHHEVVRRVAQIEARVRRRLGRSPGCRRGASRRSARRRRARP